MVLRSGWAFGVALAALVGCSAQGGGGGGGGLLPPEDSGPGGGTANCGAICARQAAANCSGFTMEACMTQCAQYASAPVCNAQINALLACGGRATFTCDDDGDPTSRDCMAENAAFLACIVPDAGGD